MKRDARNVRPSLSYDAKDKLHAALNCSHGEIRQGRAYEEAPMYFDTCWEWFQTLSAADQELVETLADVMAGPYKGAAEGMAASLPPAPRNPLQQ